MLTRGTKSVLFGAHCFLIHPFFIAWGWVKAYGTKKVPLHKYSTTTTNIFDPRLWVAFFVHDLGYIGKDNMDDERGETHPELGAAIMRKLFGNKWGEFTLLHSRYYAKRLNKHVSPLCIADKWAIYLEPSWLYLPRVKLSGELQEYLDVAILRAKNWKVGDNVSEEEALAFASGDPLRWHRGVKSYMKRWLAAHKDGAPDTWTRNRHG